MPIKRAKSFHLMLSEEELAWLAALADRAGVSSADYLRTFIRAQAETAPGLKLAGAQ